MNLYEAMDWLDGRQAVIEAVGDTFLVCFILALAVYYLGSKPGGMMDGWGKAARLTFAREIRRHG